MSNVQTSAERAPHDMSHFVYTSGNIGALKVLSHENVNAGDSLSMNVVGSFRLSPLKRGLALDTCLEVFSFYVPYRHAYDADGGTSFSDFMKAGINGDAILPVAEYDQENSAYNTRFLGVRMNNDGTVPIWLFDGYRQIYNNFFKVPFEPDKLPTIDAMTDDERRDGFACQHLKTMWSAPVDSAYQATWDVDPNTDGTIDLVNLNAQYGRLHTEQERSLFMKRYRDVIESFGGYTTIDADSRPKLLMRSKFWASGYDVDGTDQSTLGQFSGRVQQTFNHKIPRWFCPEHGVVITLALVRFPPVVSGEIPYLCGNPSIDYSLISGDPAIVGNQSSQTIDMKHVLPQNDGTIRVPYAQYMRYHPSHVDESYEDIGDFPFLEDYALNTGYAAGTIVTTSYDDAFQTRQLGHWNIQCKFNDTIYRNLPSARDALMTD